MYLYRDQLHELAVLHGNASFMKNILNYLFPRPQRIYQIMKLDFSLQFTIRTYLGYNLMKSFQEEIFQTIILQKQLQRIVDRAYSQSMAIETSLHEHWRSDMEELLNPNRAMRIPYHLGFKYVMLAAADPAKWRSTPRDVYGYPVPASMVRKDTKRAHRLMENVRLHADVHQDPDAYISRQDDEECTPFAHIRAFANYFVGKIILHTFPLLCPPRVFGEGRIIAVIAYSYVVDRDMFLLIDAPGYRNENSSSEGSTTEDEL